jgi:hypothetical protein
LISGSKTYIYIKTLDAREKKELDDFISSPYFNKDQQIIKLYKQLLLDNTDPKDLYRKATAKKYNEKELRYLLSDLNQLIETYLSHAKFNLRSSLKKQLLIEHLHDKKLSKYIEHHQQALIKESNSQTLQDSDHLAKKLAAEEMSFRFSTGNNRGLDSRLQDLSDSIDKYYFSKKLKYACEMINRSNVLHVKYDISFIDQIKSFLKDSRFLEVPAVSVYYHILSGLSEPGNEKHYRDLRSKLLQFRNVFSDHELRDMFTFAQNYCIRQLNLGKGEYLEELFHNYSYLLKERIILTNNILSQFDFKNIVTIALRLKEFDWVKNFIKQYLQFVPQADRLNAEIYNLSRYHYAVGDNRKALKIMQDVEFTDVYYQLDAKVLLLKIYYDTNTFDSFLALIKSFTNYLKRNGKVSAYQRDTYLNFVKIISKMFNYKMFDKGDIDKVKKEFTALTNVADVNWLRGKIAELE